MPKKGNNLNITAGVRIAPDSDQNVKKLQGQIERLDKHSKRIAAQERKDIRTVKHKAGYQSRDKGIQKAVDKLPEEQVKRLAKQESKKRKQAQDSIKIARDKMRSEVMIAKVKANKIIAEERRIVMEIRKLAKYDSERNKMNRTIEKQQVAQIRRTARKQSKLNKEMREGGQSAKAMGLGVTMVAWHLRYLGNTLSNISRQMIQFVSNTIRAGADLQDAMFGLHASVSIAGQSIEESNEIVENFGKKGIMTMSSAISNLNRLMITNSMSLSEAEDAMKRYLDVGALASDNQESIAESMEAMTKAIIKGSTTLSTDPALMMVWRQMEYHADVVHKKTLDQLTMEQRASLFRKTLAEDFGGLAGLHEARLGLITSQLVRLTEVQQIMSLAFTNSMHPAILVVVDAVVAFSDVVKSVLDRMGSLFPALVMGTIAMITFFGAVLTTTAALISMYHIKKQLAAIAPVENLAYLKGAAALTAKGISANFATAGMFALNFAMKRMIPILFIISSLVTLGSYLWMKYSGAIDRSKKSANMASKGVEDLRNKMLLLNEGPASDSGKAEKDRARQHQRALEDLEEELARERSKGLWADQLKIKDLEKRIAREKEDYANAQEDKESADQKGLDGWKDVMDDLFATTEDTTEGIENLWKDMWSNLSNNAKIALAGLVALWGVNSLMKILGFGSLGSLLIGKLSAAFKAAGIWIATKGLTKIVGGILLWKAVLIGLGVLLALWLIYKFRDEIKEFITNLHKNFKEWLDKNGFENVGEAIAHYMSIGIDKIKTYIEKLNIKIEEWLDKNGFEDVGEAIGTYLHTGIVNALKILNTLHEKVNTWLIEQDWNAIGTKIGTWIGNSIVGIFKSLWSLPTLPIKIIEWLIEADWSKIGDAISGFLKKSFIRNMLALFTGGLSEAMYIEINKDKEGYGKIGTEIARHIVNRIKSYFSLGNIIVDLTKSIGSAIMTSINNAISNTKWPKITPPPVEKPKSSPTTYKSYDPRTWFRQTGHYQVPGKIGQPIPTILHGGERVIPQHEVGSHGGGGGNVINIYNPSVRNDNDITKLANAVSEALAQKQKWARLGAY